jgi:hypothetical protein
MRLQEAALWGYLWLAVIALLLLLLVVLVAVVVLATAVVPVALQEAVQFSGRAQQAVQMYCQAAGRWCSSR